MISALLAALVIGPAFSGSWYAPERNGEGFTLQVLENGTAHALWFTYPPAGSTAQQAWIYASGGTIDGDTIRFSSAYTTRGPRFGAQFDPSAVQLVPWGTIEFRFTGCNSGQMTYSGPSAWGSGSYGVTRLTALSELECGGKRRLSPTGTRLLEGMRSRSGGWYDPAHNGEGWQVEELPDGRTQVYWFTYDSRGEQAWTIGVSDTSGTRMTVSRNLRPVGAHFGTAFKSSDVQLQEWGSLELDFDTCTQGRMSYASSLADFGSGSLKPTRLTIPAAAPCIDATPSRPSSVTWSGGAAMPRAQSEAARAILGTQTYVAGGFNEPRSFQRYDAASNAWTALPDMPGGRDHAEAAAIDGSVYVAGGNPGGGDQSSSGWRYIVAENRWESVPQLPSPVASGAASLAGYLWFGSADGSLTQFNPRTRNARVIPGDNRAPRDHSQVVAFGGELWMIGGRGSGETARVSIFDPASETWRAGPTMRVPRAGSAVAASDSLLVVAGGEVIQNGSGVSSVIEAIAAGESAWQDLSSLPTPVHGAAGAIGDNAFYVLGGSTMAGGIQNPGTVQVATFSSTRISFAKANATGAPNANVDVGIVRSGGASGAYDVYYTVDGPGCSGSFTAGPVHFGDGEMAKTISVPLRASGTCMVWLVPSDVIGALRVMSITIVPVVAGCPAPSSDDVTQAALAGIGNPLLQRQRSGEVMFLELPTLTQGSSGQVMFSESAGGAYTPQPVTLEISISRCPAVIDTDTNNACNYRTTNGSFSSVQWLFKPVAPMVDAASANARGLCWAADAGPHYVNARWTYSACPSGVDLCGFAVQYNQGAY